jgi:hypothetical protein
MRTTLTLDEPIATALKNVAHRTGKPFKKVVNETLRAGLSASKSRAAATRPYQIKPAALGGLCAPADINKALQLADTLEDGELRRKLEQRK